MVKKKRVSIKDIAVLADVSYQTVSKVLNGQNHVSPDKAERIRQAAVQLGYRPNKQARNLRANRSRFIGYSWINGPSRQGVYIQDKFLTSMVIEAEQAGYRLLPFAHLESGGDRVDVYRELTRSSQVDGFVMSSIDYHDPRSKYLLSEGVPFVTFGRSYTDDSPRWVDVDGQAGFRMATEHLIELGHERIAVFAWSESSRVGQDRFAGFKMAMETAGLPIRPELVSRGPGLFEYGMRQAAAWLDLPEAIRPTAILAVNDEPAIGAVRLAVQRGLRVGHDLAVVGFDDTPMAEMIGLTSVSQPVREAGRLCVELLINWIEGRDAAEPHRLLQPALIIRESSTR
jgi:DNA-binding LacI/PurR family transcriptional regulator